MFSPLPKGEKDFIHSLLLPCYLVEEPELCDRVVHHLRFLTRTLFLMVWFNMLLFPLEFLSFRFP